MCLIGFSSVASISVVAPILSIYLTSEMNASAGIVGLVTAAFFISSALTEIFLGIIAGGKKTITFLVFAFALLSICPALYPFANSIAVLVVLRAVHGFAYSFIETASMILAALAIPSAERDKAVGVYTASLSIGLLIGPAITTFSIPLFGVLNMFYFASLFGLVGVFAAFFLSSKFRSIERDWHIIGVAVGGESLKSKASAIFHNKLYDVAFVGNLAFFALFGVLLAYAPIYAKDRLGLDYGFVSVLFLLYYIATTVTRLSLGRIVGRVSKTTIIILGTGFAALFSAFLVVFTNSFVFAVVFALIGAVQGVLFPVGSMLIAEHIEPSRNVLANSIFSTGVDIGQGLAPLAAATVIYYGLEYGFVMSSVICVIATFLVVLLSKKSFQAVNY